MTHSSLSSAANKIIMCRVASICWEGSLLSVSETLCLEKGVLEHPFFFFFALLWFPKHLASQPDLKIGSIFPFSLMGLQDLWYILDIHVSWRRGSQSLSPELLRIEWKTINYINFREKPFCLRLVWAVCKQLCWGRWAGEIVSDRREAILPFGSEADSTDLYGDSSHKQGCKFRFCLKELGKSRAFGSGWARKVVGAGPGHGRGAPAASLLSGLTRSVPRARSWAVTVLGQHT